MLIDGIKVEIQGTEPIAPADLDGLTDKQILYVGAHRYALESATMVPPSGLTGACAARGGSAPGGGP